MPGKLSEQFFEFLYHSYLYYKLNRNEIEDAEYDVLCAELLENWDEISHPCKSLVSQEDLRAGTGYAIQYPAGLERTIWKRYRGTEE